jgi:hypothetical protein
MAYQGFISKYMKHEVQRPLPTATVLWVFEELSRGMWDIDALRRMVNRKVMLDALLCDSVINPAPVNSGFSGIGRVFKTMCQCVNLYLL